MAYEFGCILDFGEHEICDTEDTLAEAMWKCKDMQLDWDGKLIGCWRFNGNEWHAASSDPHEPWYVRATDD